MKKRIIAVFLALFIGLLVACGTPTTSDNDVDVRPTQTNLETEIQYFISRHPVDATCQFVTDEDLDGPVQYTKGHSSFYSVIVLKDRTVIPMYNLVVFRSGWYLYEKKNEIEYATSIYVGTREMCPEGATIVE